MPQKPLRFSRKFAEFLCLSELIISKIRGQDFRSADEYIRRILSFSKTFHPKLRKSAALFERIVRITLNIFNGHSEEVLQLGIPGMRNFHLASQGFLAKPRNDRPAPRRFCDEESLGCGIFTWRRRDSSPGFGMTGRCRMRLTQIRRVFLNFCGPP